MSGTIDLNFFLFKQFSLISLAFLFLSHHPKSTMQLNLDSIGKNILTIKNNTNVLLNSNITRVESNNSLNEKSNNNNVNNDNNHVNSNKELDPIWYLNKFGYLNKSKKQFINNVSPNKKSGNLIMLASLKSSSPFNSQSNESLEESVEDAIKKFQKHAKLNITGKLDNKTIEIMKMPRCGLPDLLSESDSTNRNFLMLKNKTEYIKLNNRNKRYALQGSKWSKSKLRFRVGKYPKYSSLSKDLINKELKRALDLWSEAADVEFDFKKSSSFGSVLLMGIGDSPKQDQNYDIDVRFETGYHGDSEPFDGSGLILGHAYFPEFGGSTHFDADELWTSRSSHGVNLYQVAVHEFGHALGLEHSENFDAIMAPFFRGYAEDFHLHQDDLTAIELLYGKSKRHFQNKIQNENENLENHDDNNSNNNQDVNNFYNNNKENSIDNKDNYDKNNDFSYYNFNENKYTDSFKEEKTLFTVPTKSFTESTTSKILRTIVPPSFTYQLPKVHLQPQNPEFTDTSLNALCLDGKFDAISLLSDGFTYIFKDAYVFKINSNFVMDATYPRLISNVFRGWNGITFMSLPNNLDTVLYVPDNDVTYFFKNNLYWRSSKLHQLDPGYPRLVSENFKGLDYENGFNGKLDASFVWGGNRRVYFVEGDRYWRYDFDLGAVEIGYPKKLSIWRGLPAKITDAFQWINGITYFFEKERYYRFNDLSFKVEDTFPTYPRLNSEYWFGCSNYNRLGKLILSPVNSKIQQQSIFETSTSSNEYETIKLDQPILLLNYSMISPTTSKIEEDISYTVEESLLYDNNLANNNNNIDDKNNDNSSSLSLQKINDYNEQNQPDNTNNDNFVNSKYITENINNKQASNRSGKLIYLNLFIIIFEILFCLLFCFI